MYYTIYQVTNKINGKIYIGKHQTKNPNDSYFGSGQAIQNAIRKHGKKNFKKEILFIFNNELEMNQKEKEIVTEEFINNENNYNKGVGGAGGPHFKNKKHSEKTKLLLAEKSRGRTSNKGQIPWNKGKKGVYSEEHIEKLRQAIYKRNNGLVVQ